MPVEVEEVMVPIQTDSVAPQVVDVALAQVVGPIINPQKVVTSGSIISPYFVVEGQVVILVNPILSTKVVFHKNYHQKKK
jgi:hypothetical protein